MTSIPVNIESGCSDNVIDVEGGCYIASKLSALYQKLLPNPAKNITQLFLQHNCFTKKSIEEFTDKLTQLPYTFTIHLSLQWKDCIEKKLSLSPHVEKLLVINVQNNNLVLQTRQQPQHSTQPIASLTCNDIPAQHDKRPDVVPRATDGTDEDDTGSECTEAKEKRRGCRRK